MGLFSRKKMRLIQENRNSHVWKHLNLIQMSLKQEVGVWKVQTMLRFWQGFATCRKNYWQVFDLFLLLQRASIFTLSITENVNYITELIVMNFRKELASRSKLQVSLHKLLLYLRVTVDRPRTRCCQARNNDVEQLPQLIWRAGRKRCYPQQLSPCCRPRQRPQTADRISPVNHL